ncbi:DUF4153 domain-containing protein [Labedaea rhizosphaerae]|uniref:Uncharacterized protein DUF4173 n=1 Tax=Labedaea rhizosphaerae TaxID=598644 RepID=A0A4R6RRM9_LABRH|nr:DUF4173 domain-containing protein [Labedaea rhizosphaerae]TDP88905.1 uncharacterized protein DUF4173 [Labedaea rhizosphaerae]
MTYSPMAPAVLDRRPRPPLVSWAEPAWTAPHISLPVTLLAGLLAACTVPTDRPGLGWLVAGLVVAGAIRVVTRHRPTARPGAVSRIRWGIVTFALLTVPVLRAAPWLSVLCLATAVATGSLAVAGGRSLRATLAGMVAVPVGALLGLPWLWASRRRSATAERTFVAVVASFAVLLVFGALLAGGDAAFSVAIAAVMPRFSVAGIQSGVLIFVAAVLLVVGGCYTAAARPQVRERDERKTVRALEWALPVGALTLLYGGYVAVQVAVLFGGRDYVLRTSGLTAAQYARSGFWWLAIATALTLVVLGIAARLSAVDSVLDRVRRRLLLGPLAVLTLVIVASALSRMWAYQEAYGFTVLRLLVEVCELWIGVVYVLVLIAGLGRGRAKWLPYTVIASAVAGLLAIAALDPERFVAERDVARYAETGKIDTAYLASLSADATPALAALPASVRDCTLALQARHLRLDDGALDWNLGRSRAASYRMPTGFTCG